MSPMVALALTKDLSVARTAQGRVHHVFTPVGPPPPMTPSHGTVFSLGLLWNNYGRHTPAMHSQVTGFLWDWRGMPKHVSWILVCVTIQDKTFLVSHAPATDWKRYHTALAGLGEGALVDPARRVSAGAGTRA